MGWQEFLDKTRQADVANLDIRHIGAWPTWLRAAMMAALFTAVLGGGHLLALSGANKTLQRLKSIELDLRQAHAQKTVEAAPLAAFRAQHRQAAAALAPRLPLLPAEAEVPSLIDHITEAAQDSNLSILEMAVGVEGQPERRTAFHAELPIDIRVSGGYHQFGAFVSRVANLPRIVTLHDFDIRPLRPGEGLTMRISAKTYRHLEKTE